MEAAGGEGDGNGTPPAPTAPATPPAPGQPAPRTFTQEEVDAFITARLDREKKAREKEAAKAAEDAEAKRLEEQKEFAKLAAKHEGRVKELEPELEGTRAERDELRQYVTKQIDAATKDWPESLKKLIPTEGAALARLQAFTTAQAVFEELKGQPRTPAPGNGPRAPQPTGDNQNPTEAQLQQKRATGRYAF
jgi:hypothetical protein